MPKYDEEMIQPIRQKITNLGFEDLRTKDDVEDLLERDGNQMIFINSVCGCVGKVAQPALQEAVDYEPLPKHLGTVFAGQDDEATEFVRSLAPDCPPSSPSIFLYQDGEPVQYVPRQFIRNSEPEEVTEVLTTSFDKYCGKTHEATATENT